NLYGDLPARSERASGDWVIKDDLYAVWVSGRKPKGSGWELDANLKRDTGKWIEVIGKPETRNGVTYVRAAHVRITDPPRPTAGPADRRGRGRAALPHRALRVVALRPLGVARPLVPALALLAAAGHAQPPPTQAPPSSFKYPTPREQYGPAQPEELMALAMNP